MMRIGTRTLRPEWVLLVALTVSSAVNVFLAAKLREMRLRNQPGVTAGVRLANLVVPLKTGRSRTIPLAGPETIVLYHFSPDCGWCERNWENVRSLVSSTQGRIRFVGLSKSAVPAEFLASRRVNFEVIDDLPPDVVAKLRLGATPQTIVVKPGGLVAASWFGAFSGEQRVRVESFFSVSLPGLTTLAKK